MGSPVTNDGGDDPGAAAGAGLLLGDDGQRDLWRRLAGLELDDPSAAFDFTGRLARDNGWTRPFATRAIEEYRRFVFLGQVAGHPVTPSDEVDQVWHLHLTYTRSYWDELCGAVLGAPFHHGPTKGGSAEADKFDDWYARTKASYERWFGHPPPADLWPSAERRFGDAPHYVRVNLRNRWLVPKPPVRPGATRAGGLAAAGIGLAGCSGGALGLLAQSDGGLSPLFWLLLPVGVLIFVAVVRSAIGGGGGRRGGGSGCGHHGGGSCGSDGGGGCGGSGCGGGGCGGCGA